MGTKTKFYVNVSNLHDEVTGSCHFVAVTLPNNESIKFIVDCGLFQEKQFLDLNSNFPFKPDILNFALITHTHIDHIGRLPLLYKKGFYNTTYISNIAYPFLKDALENTAIIFNQNKKRNNECSQVLYSINDVDTLLNKTTPIKYNQEFYPHENVKVTFFENAHLLGASYILVNIHYEDLEPINLLFTGDVSFTSNFRTIPDLPEYVYNMNLTMFTESTYGTTNSNDIEQRFETNILKAIDEGKSIFLPAFSMQRTQEILFALKKLQLNGKLPLSIPIYSDGSLSISYTQKFLRISDTFKEDAKEFLPENLTYVNKKIREGIINNNVQKIITSSSGMCSYGPAITYISNILSKKNYLIHLNGYSAEGSLSRQLFDSINAKEPIITIQGLYKVMKCSIDYTFEFSSHLKKDELTNFINKFTNLKLLMISHGDLETKKNFGMHCVNNTGAKDVAIQSPNIVFKIGSYGLIKSYSTKFI